MTFWLIFSHNSGNTELVVWSPALQGASAVGYSHLCHIWRLSRINPYTFLDQETSTWSVFGQGTLHFGNALRATLGVRYSETEKEGRQGAVCLPFGAQSLSERDTTCELSPDFPAILATAAQLDPAAPDPAVVGALASLVNGRELALVTEAVAHVLDLNRDDDHLSWNLALQWDAAPTFMVYGSVAAGFKAGGFNASAGTPDPSDLSFDNEEVLAFEIGAKMRFLDNSADLNLALYDMDYDDLQVAQFTGDTGIIVRNAAAASIRGIELDGRWRPTNTVLLQFALAWNDFEWDKYPTAGCTVPQLIQTGLSAAACANAEVNDLSGKKLNAPSFTGHLMLSKLWPMGRYELQARARMNWADDFISALDLDPATGVDDLTLFDLDARFGPRDGRWGIALLVSNIFDEEYIRGGDDVPLFDLSYTVAPGRPRGVALRFDYSIH